MAAAILLTADQLATEWVFTDGHVLTAQELGEFLKKESEASLSERGYEYMCDWVAANAAQFQLTVERGEHYGVVEDGVAKINRGVFNRVCSDAGISSKALLSNLKAAGLLVLGPKGYTRTKNLDGIPTACVWMRLPSCEDDEGGDDEDDLPL